jgi:sugar/nucleoside kinase (ribokinase family)
VSAKTFDYTSMGFITFDCLGWPFTAVPPGGGCNFIDELTLAVSGAAGVAAIAAAKMGLRTRAVGGVGRDLMGDWVMHRLKDFKVDTEMMQHEAGRHRLPSSPRASTVPALPCT